MNNRTTSTIDDDSCEAPHSALLVLISILSLFGCLYVLISYIYIRKLRRHPAGIMFGMSCYAACYHCLFLMEVGLSSVHCTRIAPLVEFFLTGQESYLLMFACDLILALKNPFRAEKTQRMVFYHSITALTSFIFALIAYADTNHALFGFCWMNLSATPTMSSRQHSRSGIFFAVQIIIVYFFSLAAMVRSWKRLEKGLPDTFRTRTRMLRHLKYYVGIFFVYWTVVFVLYSVYKFLPGVHRCRVWNLLSGVLLSKGLVNAIIWTRTSNIYIVLAQIRGYVPPSSVDIMEDEGSSINWALRREILTNTTKGIVSSIERAERQAVAQMVLEKKFTEIEELVIVPEVEDLNASKKFSQDDPYHDHPDQDVTFYDYAPHVFRYLRGLSSIASDDYRLSFEETTKERVSEGKSGAFFYFTQDRKYVVKTLSREELQFLLLILPQYCRYVAHHAETLIARFFGLHALNMYDKTVHFVVMQSVFDTTVQIHERYDLKGSWIGRLEGRKPVGTTAKYCSQDFVVGLNDDQRCDAREGGLQHMYDQVGKDLNWNRPMSLPIVTAQRLAKQLTRDTEFLASVHSIDYSLLVGLHHRSFYVQPEIDESRQFKPQEPSHDDDDSDSKRPFHRETLGGMSVDVVHGPGIYFTGIIDILQPWNLRKKIEHFVRVYLMFQDRNGVSVVNPKYYMERFQQRVIRDLIYSHSSTSTTRSSSNCSVQDQQPASVSTDFPHTTSPTFSSSCCTPSSSVVSPCSMLRASSSPAAVAKTSSSSTGVCTSLTSLSLGDSVLGGAVEKEWQEQEYLVIATPRDHENE